MDMIDIKAKDLRFINTKISLKEAQVLLDYLDGHGYVLGYKDSIMDLYLADGYVLPNEVVWEKVDLVSVVDMACSFNSNIIAELERDDDFVPNEYYRNLKEDEEILASLRDKVHI